MSTTRSLTRPAAVDPAILGTGSPKNREARAELAEYYRDHIGVPPALIERRLDEMSMAERVFAEIEMSERVTVMHSYDFDPLKFGRG